MFYLRFTYDYAAVRDVNRQNELEPSECDILQSHMLYCKPIIHELDFERQIMQCHSARAAAPESSSQMKGSECTQLWNRIFTSTFSNASLPP